ncbi:MAG: sugar phosphate isomerase/epimerase family protein [Sediminispirochaetaceae bacterium]
MEFALHGLLVRYSNVATDIAIAAQTGYDAVELHTDKLDRYLEAGFSGADLKSVLDTHKMKVSCIDIIGDVETQDPKKWRQVLKKSELLSRTAREIGCPTIQLNGFCELEELSERENIVKTAENIREICRIGADYGVRFQYEGAAWTPIHSIAQCTALVEEVSMENFGLVIDFWHFWASRGGGPETIGKLDAKIIYGVHIADGFRPAVGEPWPDETELRGALPGDGDVPLQEWIDAVGSTGFDGYYSGEILNHKLWEANLTDIAADALKRMKNLFKA